ncbi:MAG TPA: hypothetical protein PLQ39_08335 [Acinetobacter sp.]|nr:hypothetical protein [Acinetobacter sp.]
MRFSFYALLVVLFAVVLYLPGLTGDFVLDDISNIVFNNVLHIKELTIDGLLYAALSFRDGHGERALPMLSFALDYWRAGGIDASAFKVTNIVIHAVTTFVLALFLRRLLLLAKWTPQHAAWGALAIALIWAIHPLQVSSVLYVVQRMQTMATLFILLSLWSYLIMRQHQIAGGRGRVQGIGVVVFWLLALVCKEDAVLLPVYALLLEFVILRFQAAQAVVVRGLKQCYALFVVVGVLAYFFLIVPRHGCWADVCGLRDFNSWERLLTQGRVLVMYLGQMILPLPDRLPFIYDNYPVSRSLWQPWTTLPAWLLVTGLVVWAWCWRKIRPLFAFGVLLFFAGHLISSNIILLEMVFEHRNHFPLIGAVLALSDLVLWLCQRLRLGHKVITALFIVVSLLLAASTWHRTYIWGDSIRFGREITKLAPNSTRAWAEYSSAYYDRYYISKDPKYLYGGISVIEESLKHVNSPILVANMMMYKTTLGILQEQDWQAFFQSLQGNSSRLQKQSAVAFLFDNFLRGAALDEHKLIKAIEFIETQGYVTDYLEEANTVYNSERRDSAIIFYKKFVEVSPKDDPKVQRVVDGLAAGGYAEWANELRKIQKQNLK